MQSRVKQGRRQIFNGYLPLLILRLLMHSLWPILFHSVVKMSKRHNTLSIKKKQEIIKAIENGEKKITVAMRFNIPFSTLSSIIKKKCFYSQLPSTSKLKRRKAGEFQDLEEVLVKWFKQCRASNVPVSGALMRNKAKMFAEKLGINDFKCSDGWFNRFKKRNDITFRKICGESASVDGEICSDWITNLGALTEGYDPKNIFNADETGLFFKCLPDRTMSFKGETCHGGKNSKERITILLAVNMDGTEKLTPFIIGKAAKPRCFKNIKTLPVTYRANKRAWMTSLLFEEWLQSVNLKMKNENRKILMFIDNCPAHNVNKDLSNIEIKFLPANTTSKLQPLDKGIIQNFKTLYRKEIVLQMLDSIEDGKDLKISLLSAINITFKAWDEISKSTIKNCFRACGFTKDGNGIEITEEIVYIAQWNRLPQNPDSCTSFNEFIHFDDNLHTTVVLTDDDLIQDTIIEEYDEIEQDIPLVSTKVAKASISNLRNYFMHLDVPIGVLADILKLEKIIDKNSFVNAQQKNITDYFK